MAIDRRPRKKSAQVIFTVAAAVGISAHAQASDPCNAATFDGKVCQSAIKQKGLCSGGAWVPMTYSEKYPYYYDQYSAYLLAGGMASPVAEESCKQPGFFGRLAIARGGFGTTGARWGSGG